MAEQDSEREDHEPDEKAAERRADEQADATPEGDGVPLDEEAAWAAIVAGYGDEPPDPPGAKPFKTIEDLALLDEDLAAAVELTAAPLTAGDARVTWGDGSLNRDQAAIRHAITAALTELGLLEPAAVARTHQRSMAHAE